MVCSRRGLVAQAIFAQMSYAHCSCRTHTHTYYVRTHIAISKSWTMFTLVIYLMKTYYFFVFFAWKYSRRIAGYTVATATVFSAYDIQFRRFAFIRRIRIYFILFIALPLHTSTSTTILMVSHTHTHTLSTYELICFRLEFASRSFCARFACVRNANFHGVAFWYVGSDLRGAFLCICQSIYTINILL